ncbi:MAG TPA: carboxypeptidase-like regulatory domain-containing protein, partial [Terriglobia bacterium]|nr:carboxypeptidase-like regulatory domain-containing protein [Terriglobia bacterium]
MFLSFRNLRALTGALLSVFLTSFLFPRPVPAQFDTASVLGTIRDESGAVLAGATVTLTNQA